MNNDRHLFRTRARRISWSVVWILSHLGSLFYVELVPRDLFPYLVLYTRFRVEIKKNSSYRHLDLVYCVPSLVFGIHDSWHDIMRCDHRSCNRNLSNYIAKCSLPKKFSVMCVNWHNYGKIVFCFLFWPLFIALCEI